MTDLTTQLADQPDSRAIHHGAGIACLRDIYVHQHITQEV
jgi:hypothetical protein